MSFRFSRRATIVIARAAKQCEALSANDEQATRELL
jgi:hypothetical protein